MASPLTDIPEHLLAEIFVRLPDPADLARASAACVPFRRLATDGSFLRRFRRLHAPSFLAFLNQNGFHPALPPHPSAPAARALALAADFTFSFLPTHCRWTVQDVRGGRVLLYLEPKTVFGELAVCDPVRRRYLLIPPLPDDLAASACQCHQVSAVCWKTQGQPFLSPLGDDGDDDQEAQEASSFRVIWMAYCQAKITAFVFSSSTGQWRAAASKAWSDLSLGSLESTMAPLTPPCFLRRHYGYGCFYWDWMTIRSKKMLMLDTRRMEFSIVDLPPGQWTKQGIAIVEAGEGRLGMFGFHGETASDVSYAIDLSYTIAQDKGGSPSQWQMEHTISLDSRYRYCIKAATGRYLLLMRVADSWPEKPLFEYFSMDVKTLKLQRVCSEHDILKVLGNHIYDNFPPSLLSSQAM